VSGREVTVPLRLTRQAAFWVFLMLLGGCFLFVGLEQLTYLSSAPGAWMLSIILLAATAIPAGVIIYRLDQFEPEPASLIAIAVMWGGIIALTFAGITNSEALGFLQHVMPAAQVDRWGASIVAPIDEELYKGAGLVIIYLMARSEFDGVLDGLVYGAMIGLGFQVVENVQYFMLAAGESSGQVGAVIGMFFLRVVVSGLYSHMLFTGLLGFGFAYFVTQRLRPWTRRAGVLAVSAVLAWAAHFVWNSPWLESLGAGGAGAFIGSLVIKGLPFLLLLALMVVFARRRERRAFAQLIAAEVGGEVDELGILQNGRKRRHTVRAVKKARGPAAAALVKRLMREQMNLALFHARSASDQNPAIEAQRDLVVSLKRRLAGTASTSPGASA
jgi:RsiW-degrading membrane proteinase PrsW (M82 family)